MGKKTISIEEIEFMNSSHEKVLKEHGLDKSPWFVSSVPLVPDMNEIHRQINYIQENINTIKTLPLATAKNRTLQLLFCCGYSNETERIPPSIITLLGQLLEVNRYQVKYANKEFEIMKAQAYKNQHHGASVIDIANHAGVHKATVYNWIKKGILY